MPDKLEEHSKAVSEITAQVRGFYDRQQPYHIYHGSTNCTRKSSKTQSNTIDTSPLNRVLHIDPDKRVVIVEPNVAMGELVAATLPRGFIPPVVMEFPGITAGGGFAGTSGESSSFRHGFFDRTVNRIEVVFGKWNSDAGFTNRERGLVLWCCSIIWVTGNHHIARNPISSSEALHPD